MKNQTIFITIAVIIAVLGFGTYMRSQQSSQSDSAMKKEETVVPEVVNNEVMMKKENVEIEMAMLNNSGQTGKATVRDVDGKTKVVVEILSGAESVSQPSHIHLGSCATPGAVEYPLSAVQNGKAETMLDVSSDMLNSKLPLSIMVHKSKEEAKIFVSCGDLQKI